VRQPIQGMGAAAIELLVALMAGQEVGGVHVRLPTELVLRGTTRRR
jgi:LacI family transcriptional regulator